MKGREGGREEGKKKEGGKTHSWWWLTDFSKMKEWTLRKKVLYIHQESNENLGDK